MSEPAEETQRLIAHTIEMNKLKGEVRKLREDLAALQEQRCETCQHRFVGMAPAGRPHYAYCKLTIIPIPELGTQTYVKCAVLGNGCRAWARREP